MPILTREIIVNVRDSAREGILQDFFLLNTGDFGSLVRHDTEVWGLRLVEPNLGSNPWQDIDLTGATLEIGLGKPDLAPTSGTFGLAYSGDSTGLTALSATITASALQTALNANPARSAAGPVVVTQFGNSFVIADMTVGTRALLTASGNLLDPASFAGVYRTQTGSTTATEIQVLTLAQADFAFQDSFTPYPAAAYSLSTLQTGDGSHKSVRLLALDPQPFGGTWILNSSVLDWNATANDVTTALGGGYAVSQADTGVSAWTITQAADGAANPLTINATNLQVPKGAVVEVGLNSTGMLAAFTGTSDATLTLTLQARLTLPGQEPFTFLLTDVQVSRDVLNLGSMTPQVLGSYPPTVAILRGLSQRVIYASGLAGVDLDSNVLTGGGTDYTDAIQAILEPGDVRLVMDGAALIAGLEITNNSTIECLDAACGFFLKAHSPRPMIQNKNRNIMAIGDYKISILGGTWNGNAANQMPVGGGQLFEVRTDSLNGAYVTGLEFDGVDGLTIRDVEMRDVLQMNIHASNVRRVRYSNIRCNAVAAGLGGINTIGFPSGVHFNGPSSDIVLRDIWANVGDDVVAFNATDDTSIPQWGSGDITDVLLDGLTMAGSRQGIRLLSGRNIAGTNCVIDRVTIRNVRGSAYACGLQANNWTNGYGYIGSLVIENFDVRVAGAGYVGTELPGGQQMWSYLQFGCAIDYLSLSNVVQSDAFDARKFLYF